MGTKFLADSTISDVLGTLDPELFERLQGYIQRAIDTNTSHLVEIEWQNIPLKIFLDPVSTPNQIVICGGGHIALPLVSIAKLLNFRVTLIDDRVSFANKQRFPLADEIICGDFAQVIPALPFNTNTYVVIVTRGHRHDKTCLEEVLKKPAPAYIGMIGSRKKVAAVKQYLQQSEFSKDVLDSVHAPIGLDIGAETPEEIAVSIMAEIIMTGRGHARQKAGGTSSGV